MIQRKMDDMAHDIVYQDDMTHDMTVYFGDVT